MLDPQYPGSSLVFYGHPQPQQQAFYSPALGPGTRVESLGPAPPLIDPGKWLGRGGKEGVNTEIRVWVGPRFPSTHEVLLVHRGRTEDTGTNKTSPASQVA